MTALREGAVLTVPNRLSYSQVSKYAECGERYRLEYGRGIKGASWYASVAGRVIHLQTELADRRALGDLRELVPSFESEFRRQLAEEEAKGVVHKASGKTLDAIGWTGGPNKKDVEWWLKYGPEYLPLWTRFRNETEWQIATVTDPATGEVIHAIELEFEIQLGDETTIGYIDRVFWDPATNEYIIVDLKSGALPAGKLQLGDYKVGLQAKYGIEAAWGVYWTIYQPRAATEKTEVPAVDDEGNPVLFKSGPRKGQPKMVSQATTVEKGLQYRLSDPQDLSMWDREYAEARYEMARAGISAGVFLPHVTSMCRGCGVKRYCRAVGGDRSVLVPVRELFITKREPKKEELVLDEDLTLDE